jgi:hypothetical protein
MFTSFCIRYAGMEDYPIHAHCPTWINVLTEQDLFRVPSEYIPKTGDLIFFDWERDGSADHVGFVAEVVFWWLIVYYTMKKRLYRFL